MTPIEEFLQNLITIDLWQVAKGAILLGLGLYVIFAVVVVRQVELMIKTINGALEVPLRLIAWIHLAVAVGVVLFAVVVL